MAASDGSKPESETLPEDARRPTPDTRHPISDTQHPTPNTRRTEFGANWWARRWIGALERFGWDTRLRRGRSYARTGQVRSIEVLPGRVDARVKGSRPRPYVVRITLAPLADDDWDQVLDALAGQARFAALLLAGELPPTIEEVFQSVGAPLFPDTDQAFESACSCPDLANPCKHVAAVHYVLGAEFDRDPFLLFRLRGRTREQLIAALRARRASDAPTAGRRATDDTQAPPDPGAPEDEPLVDLLDRFWALGEGFGQLRFAIEPPRVSEAVLKRLGSPFQEREGERPVLPKLARFYGTISEAAIRTAYEDT